jgi:hypothetical protein
MKVHILASKEISPCNCKNDCRAKYGSYSSKKAATEALKTLSHSPKKSPAKKASINKTSIPKESEIRREQISPVSVPADITDPVSEILTNEPPLLKDQTIRKTDESKDLLDDDELVIASYDKKLAEGADAALFEQLENVVSWKLLNFYDEDGKRRNKWKLKMDPPVFRMESSAGDFAEFIVTKDLSQSLAKVFDTIYRGYFNLDAKEEKEKSGNFFANVLNWAGGNQGKALALVLIFILFVLYLTVG